MESLSLSLFLSSPSRITKGKKIMRIILGYEEEEQRKEKSYGNFMTYEKSAINESLSSAHKAYT